MARQVLCTTIVYDVCTVLEGPLQCGAHHGIVYDDESIGTAFLDVLCDAGEIDYLEEGVRRGLEEDHGDIIFGAEEWDKSGRVCRVDVVYGDALVGLEVGEETVCPAVEVVACNDGIGGFENAEYGVEGCHARGHGECIGCGGYFCEMVLCGRLSGG